MRRRSYLAAVGTTAAATLAGCSSGGTDTSASDDAEPTADWPALGYDRQNSRFAPGGTGPTDGASVEWRREVGLSTAPPTVADGTVFAPVGNDVLALDAESGDVQWRVDPEEDAAVYWSPPTVHDGVAYLAGNDRIRALDAADGTEQWSVGVEASTGYLAPTLGRGGRGLYVAAGETVYRLSPEDGEEEWSRELFGPIRRTMAISSPLLFVVTEGGDVYALSTDDGSGYWRTDLPDAVQCEPTADDHRVYVGCFDGNVYALGQRGQVEWTTEVGGFAKGGIAVAHDRVYADGGRRLHALDRDDGETQWSVGVGTTGDHPPVVVGSTVYTGGAKLRALKPGGGIGVGGARVEPARYTASPGNYVGGIAAADGRLFAFVWTGEGDDDRHELVALA